MADLVLDVGMHNGDDTAYYLTRGCDVVAVEANPEFSERASRRFAAEIRAGRLVIRNVGIAERAGEMEFWVSARSEWSSFDREHATMNGTPAHRITVPTVPFSAILDDCRTPKYLKIDIELSDRCCLRALEGRQALPEYISFEGNLAAAADIGFLAGLGYRSFKCVRQNDWRQITPRNLRWQGRARKAIAGAAGRALLHKALLRAHYRGSPVDGWRFTVGSSGPMGPELRGRWMARDEVLAVWDGLLTIDRELDARGLGEWFDIHATGARRPDMEGR